MPKLQLINRNFHKPENREEFITVWVTQFSSAIRARKFGRNKPLIVDVLEQDKWD